MFIKQATKSLFQRALSQQLFYGCFNSLEGQMITNKLRNKIASEIFYLQNNLFDYSEYDEYFKEHNWTIKFTPKKALVQFSKFSKEYEICATTIIKAHNPLSFPKQNIFKKKDKQISNNLKSSLQQKVEDGDCPLTQISLHIKKKKTEKWFVCEFVVYEDFVVRATNFFADFYNQLPVTIMNIGKYKYNGPSPTIIDSSLNKAIAQFLKECGLNSDIIMNFARYSSNCEQRLIYQWLKNIQQFTRPIKNLDDD